MACRFNSALRIASLCALFGVLLGALHCGSTDLTPALPGHEPRTGTLRLDKPDPQVALPGLRYYLLGTGFQPAARGTTRLFFSGQRELGGATQPLELDLPSEYDSATRLVVPIDQALFDTLSGGALIAMDVAVLTGTLTLQLEQDNRLYQRSTEITLSLRTQLDPAISGVSKAVFLGDDVVIQGDGFLLEGEGKMVLILEGAFSRQVQSGEQGSTPQSQVSLYPRIEHTLTPVSRTEARLPVLARTFGIQPGTLYAEMTIENRQITSVNTPTDPIDIALSLLRTQLNSLDTSVIRRGQRAGAFGAGFLPQDPSGDTATTVRLSGSFTVKADSSVLPVDLTLVTEVTDSHRLVFVPHPVFDPMLGRLTGLGATPGRFVGTIQPEVRVAASQQAGVPLPCSPSCVVDIGSPMQLIYLKFLGNFTEGLRRFGLRNLEPEVIERAVAIVRRTYMDWNIDVRLDKPTDYDEYTTIEIGGPDPNGAGLFGLDNNEALDRGNLRLNDYIGGFNAASDHKGVYGFGGVFIESFLGFSPRAEMPLPIASPRFDDLFSAFVPEYGGQPADRTELAGGERQAKLEEAVRALGALIGGTIAHEFGHNTKDTPRSPVISRISDGPRILMQLDQNIPRVTSASISWTPKGPLRHHRRGVTI